MANQSSTLSTIDSFVKIERVHRNPKSNTLIPTYYTQTRTNNPGNMKLVEAVKSIEHKILNPSKILWLQYDSMDGKHKQLSVTSSLTGDTHHPSKRSRLHIPCRLRKEVDFIKEEMDLAKQEVEVDELIKAHDLIANHLYSFIKPMSLKCAVQLGIVDAICGHGKPMTLLELTTALSIHPTKTRFLPHLMRMLTHMGYFSEPTREDGLKGYALNPASELLLKDHPFTNRSYLLSMLDPNVMNPWHCLANWMQCDKEDPFSMANGMTLWEYAGQHTEFNSNFNKAMAADSQFTASVLAQSRGWGGFFDGVRSLVDVGGGTGEMASAIATAFPHIKCTVLDLPHVVEGLQGTHNLAYVVGDMFEAVPPADAVLLKRLLHDWSDEDCVKIMKQCRKAVTAGNNKGKVMIIDVVMDDDEKNIKDKQSRETQLFYDMEMMAIVKGKERTLAEWKKLLEDAGFVGGYKIHPVMGIRSLIEVYPC